jgi:RimJ/RimL family protein N-acetyltransferase
MTPQSRLRTLAEIELVTPFPESEIPAMWFWIQPFLNQVTADGGPTTLEEFVDRQRERADRVVSWGVYREGELGGYIEFEPGSPTMGLGHGLFKKAFWGQKTTVPAINKAMMQVFASGVEFVMFTPFAHNAAIRALLRRIGAVENGILKARYTQNGLPIDAAVLGLVCDEWIAHNPEYVTNTAPPAPAEES